MKPYTASQFDHDCCRPFLHEEGETGVLLLHGFTGCVSHLRPLGDALADRGYATMGINLPGHATTETDMALSDWKQWLDASRTALLKLKKDHRKVAVAGLSMGGDIALILAQEGLTDACVTISAPMATKNRLIALSGMIAPVKPRVSWAIPEDRHRLMDEKFDYGYSGFPTRKAMDLLKLIRMARGGLASVDCPLLAVQSAGDETIWTGSADLILTEARSQIKQKLALTDAPHVCTLSPEMPKIVRAMDALMKTLLPD